MLTVEKLKAMLPWEIFASGEWIDDWKIFNIRWEWKKIQWVAVRWQWYHDWTIYCHLIYEEDTDDILQMYYSRPWDNMQIAIHWDKLTNANTIRTIVPCDDEAFNLYRY